MVFFRNTITWNGYCRESFSSYFNSSTIKIGFIYKNLDIQNLNEFFIEVEKILGLEHNPTIFYRTQVPWIVVVTPSSWWKANYFRRQMFSMFLRCAGVYYKNKNTVFNESIESALSSYKLTKRIKTLIKLFFNGYTNVKDNVNFITNYQGVVDFFNHNKKNIKNRLAFIEKV